MDIILLPVIKRTIRPNEALDVLKKSKRSVAVVVEIEPEGLIDSIEIRRAINNDSPDLREAQLTALEVLDRGDFVSSGYGKLGFPVTMLSAVRAHLLRTFPGRVHEQINIPDSGSQIAFSKAMSPPASHGLLGYDRGAAVVMTQSESLASKAGGPPPDCCCKNPQTPHECAAGPKTSGDVCDICTFPLQC